MLLKLSYLKYRPWLIVFLSGLFFFFQISQMHMFNILATDIEYRFHVTGQELSFISAGYFLMIALFSIPAGLITDRHSAKHVMLATLSLSALSMFVLAYTTSNTVFLITRLTQGALHAFCLLSIMKCISHDISPYRMALATGIVVTLGMFGGMFAQTPIGHLVAYLGWHNTFLLQTCFGLLLILALLVFVPKQTKPKYKENYWQNLLAAVKRIQNWQAGLFIALMNLPLLVLGALWGKRYLLASHPELTQDAASNICAMLFFGTLIGASLMGYVSDKLKSRLKPMLTCGILSTVCLLIILLFRDLSQPVLYTLFFAVGFLTSAQVLGYPYITETNPSYLTASGLAISSVLIMAAPSTIQLVFDYLFNNTSVQLAFAILPLMTLLSTLIVFSMKESFEL